MKLSENLDEYIQTITALGKAYIDKDVLIEELLDRAVEKNGLTLREVKEGYFYCPVLGKCNISKTLKQRSIAIEKELEILNEKM